MTAPTGCDTTFSALPMPLPAEENAGEAGAEVPFPFDQLLSEEAGELQDGAGKDFHPPLPSGPPMTEDSRDLEPVEIASFPSVFAIPWTILASSTPPKTDASAQEAGQATPQLGSEAIEHKLPAGTVPEPGGLEHIAENARPKALKADGMSVAKQAEMVFTDSKYEESAAPADAQQSLGVEYLESAPFEKTLTRPDGGLETRKKDAPGQDGPALIPLPQASARLTREFSVADAVVSVERTHQAVSTTVDEIGGHIHVLRSSGQEKLEVIIRPVPGTELRLEVSRVDGLVTVQARCERGDFALLDAGWPHVQSSLAAQGVRVEALQAGMAGDSGHRQGPAQQQSEREQRPAGEFFFEQDTSENKGKARSGTPSGWQNRGWQRWA